MHAGGDGAHAVHTDAAGIHEGGGGDRRVEQRLEGGVAAARLQAGGDADAGELAGAAQTVALFLQILVAGVRQHLVDHGVIVAAVVGGAARDGVGKFLAPDHVAPANFQPVEAERIRHLVHGALERQIGRPLAEAAHRLLRGLIGHHGNRAILHAFDLVRADDGADRLAELERRTTGIGADILQRTHFHRAHDAVVVEGDLHVEQPLRPMGVAAAHVLQPVLDQPHREAEPAREIAAEHGVLDAALDAVAAAHVHVVMHAHRRHRNLQRDADLVGVTRHLDRGIDVEHLAPGVPARRHAEGLDRHRGAAAPFHPQREMARAVLEILLDLAPDEGLVEQHVGAVRLVHQHGAGLNRLFGVEHEGQLLVGDSDFLRRVFGKCAGIGDHGRDPFAGIARDIGRQRPARHVRRVEPGHQRQRGLRQFVPIQHVMHARHGQRRALVDCLDARRRVGAGHQRDVAHMGQIDIGDELPLADHEAAVLAHAAVGRDVAVAVGAHLLKLRGLLAPRMRSAASAIASTICA